MMIGNAFKSIRNAVLLANLVDLSQDDDDDDNNDNNDDASKISAAAVSAPPAAAAAVRTVREILSC